jgi:uncharacterized protein YceH (UPF0502 family)
MLPSVYELEPPEVAVLDVMLLRGPQTLGELRTRTERLYGFSGLGEIQETLDSLARREDPLIVKLERLPGQKDARYAHLISGPIDMERVAAAATSPRSTGPDGSRVDALEQQVAALRSEVDELKVTFQEFRKQFE